MNESDVPKWQGKVVADEKVASSLALNGDERAPVARYQQEPERRVPPFVLGFVSGLLLLGMAIGGYVLARVTNDGGSSSEASASAGDQSGADANSDSGSADGGAVTTEADGNTATTISVEGGGEAAAPSVTAAPDTTEVAAGTEPSDWSATLKGQEVTLLGRVPDQATADFIFAAAADVLGEENVVNQFSIDPSVFMEEGYAAPIVFQDVALFDVGGTDPGPDSQQVLGIIILGMQNNPQATLEVVTYTDASGSAEFNQRLAQRRAEAIRDIMVAQGIETERIVLDPRGEEEGASEAESADQAAARRRAEFTVIGLLG